MQIEEEAPNSLAEDEVMRLVSPRVETLTLSDLGRQTKQACPLCPRERTCSVRPGMSEKCLPQTDSCIAAKLIDHLIGQREQRGRHGEAERIRGLAINDEFELCRQLDG